MARPIGGVGTESTRGPQTENYGQKRSELAHAVNDLRFAQKHGSDADVAKATTNLAKLLGVDLGNTTGKSGSDLLKLLGDKVGVDATNLNQDTLQSLQRSVTDHSKLMSLIGTVK